MPKILSNKPWLLPVMAFLGFVALWVAFIFFAVKHKPREVERVQRHAVIFGTATGVAEA